jgi:hypothetical protein
LWSGGTLFEPADITVPTLIVRGEWDSYSTDATPSGCSIR